MLASLKLAFLLNPKLGLVPLFASFMQAMNGIGGIIKVVIFICAVVCLVGAGISAAA